MSASHSAMLSFRRKRTRQMNFQTIFGLNEVEQLALFFNETFPLLLNYLHLDNIEDLVLTNNLWFKNETHRISFPPEFYEYLLAMSRKPRVVQQDHFMNPSYLEIVFHAALCAHQYEPRPMTKIIYEFYQYARWLRSLTLDALTTFPFSRRRFCDFFTSKWASRYARVFLSKQIGLGDFFLRHFENDPTSQYLDHSAIRFGDHMSILKLTSTAAEGFDVKLISRSIWRLAEGSQGGFAAARPQFYISELHALMVHRSSDSRYGAMLSQMRLFESLSTVFSAEANCLIKAMHALFALLHGKVQKDIVWALKPYLVGYSSELLASVRS